ncbi:hypothetical protein [Mycolicibacterium goodii]|uniref:hypothetical protein n=1 Tax=Mycolicibacterium goodii TaxID=134601 RepID=UPI001BDD076E|nr:hypothetical protein [Mycolicibacterium goodii]MBU8833245.1 hypothetical protein [Mycolicibacterium goodii]
MALIEACASVEAVIERARSLYADTHSGDAQVAPHGAARLDQIAATTKAITDLAATGAPGGAYQRVVLVGLMIQNQARSAGGAIIRSAPLSAGRCGPIA